MKVRGTSAAETDRRVKAIVGQVKNVRFDRAHAFQFGASSIDFELVFHVTSADMDLSMQARQDIILGMMRRFAELGAEFAYPTQTTFTAAPDGRLVMPYPPVKVLAAQDCEEGEEAKP